MADDTRTPDELDEAGELVIKCPRCGAKSYLISETQPGEPKGGTYMCDRCPHADNHRRRPISERLECHARGSGEETGSIEIRVSQEIHIW